MTASPSSDLIVIGAGQGGGPLAGTAADHGRSVALLEHEHVGGTCVNEGHPRTGDHGLGGRAALVHAGTAHVCAFKECDGLAVLGEGAREGPAALTSPNDDGVV